MNGYESLFEDEDLFVEADEDFLEEDESPEFDDDLSERRRRRRPRRRAPRIRAGRTASGRGFFKRAPSRQPVSSSSFQASLERVGKDIRTNAAAIKRLEAQAKTATAKLNAANNSQDTAIRDLRSDLKKQGGAAQQTNQLNMLMPLLQRTPELEAKPNVTPEEAKTVLDKVQVKKQDMTLPLVLMMMASGQTGGAASSNMNMMLPLVLLLDK